MAKSKIKIVKSEENPETAELLASSIVKVSVGEEDWEKEFGEKFVSDETCWLCLRRRLDNLPRLKGWYVRGGNNNEKNNSKNSKAIR